MVPLPTITLVALRKYYKTHRNPQWIFPALGHNGGKEAQFAKDHVSDSGVQGVLQRTVKRLGFKKHIHPHVFRHAYATHLLEANIPIRHVQTILGHKTLKSTMMRALRGHIVNSEYVFMNFSLYSLFLSNPDCTDVTI